MSTKTSQIHAYKTEIADLREQIEALDKTLNRVRDENEELKRRLADAEEAEGKYRIYWLDSEQANEALKQRLRAALMPADSDDESYLGAATLAKLKDVPE